ncbi:right-handed parallel beta-helix repeat-containing protein [Georgenia sp. Z1491]|uniref:right-handed parallel beta-helix repeat-containing protein n=1 Tax=Georgenia sp. Z1491 TaxID=3416707 RepID=UPI003CEC1FE2
MAASHRRTGGLLAVTTALFLAACSSSDAPVEPQAVPDSAEDVAVDAEPEIPPPTRADFPDETTTGVPEGIELEESGSLTIDEDGAVVEGLEITGTVTVEADDVTIRNTRILNTGHFPIRVSGGSNLVVEDSEIDGQGRADAAVAFSSYTLRRVHIHNVAEGPRIAGSNVTIEDSLIHQLVQVGDNHTDVIQVVSGSGIVIRGNALEVYNPEQDVLGNAAFMFGEDDGPVTDCLVEGNYLNGGNYTVNGGGGGTDGAACTFRDNVLGPDHNYGAVANLGPQSDWDDSNLWIDTHDPVRGG